jgi:catechol 2,3-dioxygenase-like lactoylglutathione lyase family enzyme
MATATGIHHYGMTVADIGASRDWYGRVFGLIGGKGATGAGEIIEEFLEVPGANMEALFLGLGDAHLELIQYYEPRVDSHQQLEENDAGAAHVCFRVADIQAAHAALVADGVEVVREPFEVPEGEMGGYWILRLHDPDGFRIELFQAPGEGAEADAALPVEPLAFDHIGLTVPDLERSVEWYTKLFGLGAGPRADGSGEVVSDLLEVPGTDLRAAFLEAGPHKLELTEFRSPAGKPFTRSNNEIGANHPCFIVDDIEAVTKDLLDGGGHANGEVLPAVGDLQGYKVLYFRDPDGLQLEMFELPKGDG